MKFRIIKNKKRKKIKLQKSLPDKDLCINKGNLYKLALKYYKEYRFKNKPYGIDYPHV